MFWSKSLQKVETIRAVLERMLGAYQIEVHMNFLQKIIVPSVLILSGCSAMPSTEKGSGEVSGFKDNKYKQIDFFTADDKIKGERRKVVKQALTGYGDLSELRQYATRKAEGICYKNGRDKKMLAVSERTSVPPYIWENFPRIELTFVCVDYDRTQRSTSPVNVQSTSSATDQKISSSTDKKTLLAADKYDRLFKIKELLDAGVLTQEEFESEKKKILSEE